jgi:hypothetical protein
MRQEPDIEEVRAEILRKVEAIERAGERGTLPEAPCRHAGLRMEARVRAEVRETIRSLRLPAFELPVPGARANRPG